ncbi:MAG: LPS export ABC transporter periplasmic protein LptC [Burkholderiaceae bacterium]
MSAADAPSPVALPLAAPAPARPLSHWPRRLLDAASAYLPLMLMAFLALGTWWLVKNTPLFENARATAPLTHDPDYTMSQFMVQRFGPDGAMRVQIEGDEMRHYPDTDTLEIDNPRIRAIGPDGRVSVATAKSAVSNGDGSEVQLSGGAHVTRLATPKEVAIEFRGEFLHAFLRTERVRSHLPVVVTQGATEIRAEGMAYDHLAGVLDFKGKVRAVFTSPGARP